MVVWAIMLCGCTPVRGPAGVPTDARTSPPRTTDASSPILAGHDPVGGGVPVSTDAQPSMGQFEPGDPVWITVLLDMWPAGVVKIGTIRAEPPSRFTESVARFRTTGTSYRHQFTRNADTGSQVFVDFPARVTNHSIGPGGVRTARVDTR